MSYVHGIWSMAMIMADNFARYSVRRHIRWQTPALPLPAAD